MNAESGIYHILSNDGTLASLVGTFNGLLKVYPEKGTQKASNPMVVFSETTDNPHETKSGVSTLDGLLYQVDVYANSSTQRNTVAAAVRSALDGYSGTAAGVKIEKIQFLSAFKVPNFEADGYRMTMDFNVRQKI